MANLVKVPEKGFTINPNVGILRYLRDLLATGLYGNNYAQAVEELLRQRISQLVAEQKIEKQRISVSVDAEEDEAAA